jgi:uncharacterized surface protein with fasciclin (FAS1) repeats
MSLLYVTHFGDIYGVPGGIVPTAATGALIRITVGAEAVTATPEMTATATVTPTTGGAGAAGDDILGALQAEGLSEFVAALQAAGLAETLTGEGPFTVFAPTDEAFAAVPAATRENAEAMASILQRHIVVDQVSAADLAALGTALTMLGDTLTIASAADGTVTVDGATVIRPDLPAANGVIHVIDSVLLPPGR